jgi:hypothetical protein
MYTSRALLREGPRWSVGTGNDIHVWSDNWVLKQNGDCLKPLTYPINSDLRVMELLEPNVNEWDVELVCSIVCEEEVDSVLK